MFLGLSDFAQDPLRLIQLDETIGGGYGVKVIHRILDAFKQFFVGYFLPTHSSPHSYI